MTDNMLLAELIDKYLDGKLNQEEKSAFEQKLHTETALAEQVALQKKIIAGIKSTSRANLFQMLQEEDAKMPAYQPEVETENETENIVANKTEAKTITLNSASNRQMYYWAAAVILLLLVPVFFFLEKTNSSNDIFASYFSPYPNQEVTTGDSSTLPAQAMQHYGNRNYANALHIFEKMMGTDTDLAEAEVQFYKGNSHLALEHPKDAITCFEAVLALAPNKYTEEAEWYLALSYVKINEEKKAEVLLKKVAADDEHPYKKDAQDLLKKL
jgi:tetratricopeptide (TPR) repeat protein